MIDKEPVDLLGAAHESILSRKMSNGRFGKGVKDRKFSKFCFIEISYENFLQGTSFYSLRLLYMLLVRKNFDSSESILSVFVESGHAKHVADDFTITSAHLTFSKTTV